ncbi:hypothetical protein [uncultured Gilvimarinus sp.]|uniref:hypothetical protein n=1 Tax=uncultured Gilvimarinus sp. TaxID=1689143 RepID=UPI0030EF8F7E
MKHTFLLAASLALACPLALADLKPDIIECDGKKAVRNAAMEASVGVSGNCDAKKMADNAKDNAADKVGDRVDNTKDHIDHKVDNAKDTADNLHDHDEHRLHENKRD